MKLHGHEYFETKTGTILKVLILIFVLVVMIIVLAGCSVQSSSDNLSNNQINEFVPTQAPRPTATPDTVGKLILIKREDGIPSYEQFIMYDSRTKVMYVLIKSYATGDISISPLYHYDGSLRRYLGN